MVDSEGKTPLQFAIWLSERLKPRGRTGELIQWIQTHKRLTLTPQHIDKWKNGSEPERPRLKAIAEFFGVEYVFLLRMFDPDVPLPGKKSIHGFSVTPDGALIGAEWEKLSDEERRIVSVMIHGLVKERVLAERRATKSAKSSGKAVSAETATA